MRTILLALCGCSPKAEDSERPPRPALETGDSADSAGGPDSGPEGPSTFTTSEECHQIGDWLPAFYFPNPTLPDAGSAAPWTEGVPEDVGMDSALLEEGAAALAARGFTRSFLVLRNDKLVMERYFNGAAADEAANIHSASKSALGGLVGAAIDRGHMALEQPVAELLPRHFEGVTDPDKLAITVEHLLTMTAGFQWREDNTEYTIQEADDWLAAIVALPQEHPPGEVFNYSTGQTHLLGAALAHATGQSLCDFARDVLYSPMGITLERWGRDPQGYFSGGWGVHMTPREMAIFGGMWLDDGVFGGEWVVPPDWIEASERDHADAGGGYHYGYLWWLWDPGGRDVNIAWGYGGQLIYVVPDLELVVVMTTDTRDYAVEYDGAHVLMNYVVAAVTDP